MKDLKIIFMGTPDIAAESLRTLVENGFNIVCAVTQPDKPKGRGHKLVPTEVKAEAQKYNIPVYQPEKLKNGELQSVLDEYKPDLIAVVAYGKILPEYILNYPKYGCINMHASLLPKYRGAAPVQWSVINGEEYTGVTTMKMDIGLDTGDMLITESLKIGEYETSEELFERISSLGAKVLCETIEKIENIVPVSQNHNEHTYAPMISKEMARIDWNKTKDVISKHICGMNSWPMAYTSYKGEDFKIIEARKYDSELKGKNGEIIRYEKGNGLLVKCADGGMWLKTVQFPGGKRMGIDDYLLGHSIDIGEILS